METQQGRGKKIENEVQGTGYEKETSGPLPSLVPQQPHPILCSFGVYIHYPFCRRRCPYCDFVVSIWKSPPHEAYADAILAEFFRRVEEHRGLRAETLALGGGTPGMWEPRALARVIGEISRYFGGLHEISCEANPEDASLQNLIALREAGVNRLSLGVQSFDDRTLRGLGRLHSGEEAKEAVRQALTLFPRVSVDLIAGGPGASRDSFLRDLSLAVELGVGHISVYGLTIEPNTRFASLSQKKTLGEAPEDELAERLVLAQRFLSGAGFTQYEVSNYARPGEQSLHNSIYWRGGEYLGLGCGAHSFAWRGPDRGVRSICLSGVRQYMTQALSGGNTLASQEESFGEALLREMILSQIRHKDGLSLAWFSERFGVDLLARGGENLSRLCREGRAEVVEGYLRLTPEGIFFADDVTLALWES